MFWSILVTFWTCFRFKIVLKNHSIFGCVFYWFFNGFWEARGGPGSPKTAPKTMQKKHQKKYEKKGLQVMQVMQAFSPGRGGVPIRSLRAGRDCRSLRAQAPWNGSYRQCYKKPDKTLWTRTRASGARWRILQKNCLHFSTPCPKSLKNHDCSVETSFIIFQKKCLHFSTPCPTSLKNHYFSFEKSFIIFQKNCLQFSTRDQNQP